MERAKVSEKALKEDLGFIDIFMFTLLFGGYTLYFNLGWCVTLSV